MIVAGLAVDEGAANEVDPAWRLAAAFVLGCRTESTRRAYARDIRLFYAWCAQVGLYPLKVHRAHVDAYLRQLEQTPQPKNVLGKVSACLRDWWGRCGDCAACDLLRPRVIPPT